MIVDLKKWIDFAALVLFTTAGASKILPGQQSGDAQQKATRSEARLAFSHALPALDGTHLKVSIVEVTYPPGASSAPHSHPCPVIVYVVDGSIRSQVHGEPETIYKPGESFYEAPNGVHQVSANANKDQPAKIIAYFVCDHDTPLSIAVPEAKGAGGKQP